MAEKSRPLYLAQMQAADFLSLSIDDQFRLISRALAGLHEFEYEEPMLGDHLIDPSLRDLFQAEMAGKVMKHASVLIPLVLENGRISVFLTKRPAHFQIHPNRWCFPGGKFDPEDGLKIRTALRETFEETGIPSKKISPIGRLPNFWVCSDVPGKAGFNLSGFVGTLQTPILLNINEAEVSATTTVPLSHFMDPANARIINGEYSFEYEGKTISGSTPALLVMLRDRMANVLGSRPFYTHLSTG